MLKSYFPIYQIALNLEELRTKAGLFKDVASRSSYPDPERFRELLESISRECPGYGLTHTAEMAKRLTNRPLPTTNADVFSSLNHLDDSLSSELEKELVFRIPPERKNSYERDDLFGERVAAAFPSCQRDIRKAGNCYALGEEDGCVHHLMLVLERGLNTLASKVGVPYHRANWQFIIDKIATSLKSMAKGVERDFYLEVNAQFGFLKDAYRNHSEHARDDHYDMEKALSILNHVRSFMQALQKDGLFE